MHRTITYILVLSFFGFIGLMLPLDQTTAGQVQSAAPSAFVKERPSISGQSLARSEPGNAQGAASPASGAANKNLEGATAGKQSKPKARKAAPPADPNRRWIMKQKDDSGKRIKPRKRVPLKWAGANQQKRCRVYNETLAQSFDKARFYSIQGDRCKTAQYGRKFLKTAKLCRGACPDNFLEANGFTPLMVRNMEQLEALGQASCLGTRHTHSSGTVIQKVTAPKSTSHQ